MGNYGGIKMRMVVKERGEGEDVVTLDLEAV